MKIAKADLVPTTANLRNRYATSAKLITTAAAFCEKVNARSHRETGRSPADMHAEERARLHAIPQAPYALALGQQRVVTRSSVISLGNGP
ncbi:hypothetical protein ER308_15495 [Egibacter rhizosphaerae]|uniref:Uncharacterized protein n=1 Tax=Egibacter rhizosphaerae TaxID=1670831 RepID=A0A411YHM7_9ACTN|nr:hypothetical protein [Egibacter rhizosphaerae]QBI20835.1 hypothetical protein ER308_15495 [Egibacter rhizosphaerae]